MAFWWRCRSKRAPIPCAQGEAAWSGAFNLASGATRGAPNVSALQRTGRWEFLRMAPVLQVAQVLPNAELIGFQAHELGCGATLARRAPTLF